MTAAFDTLKYAKQLKQAGVPEDQAEIHAEALRGVIEEQIMARFDKLDEELQGIKEGGVRLEGRLIKLEGKFDGLEERLEGKFSSLEERLEGKFSSLEERTRGRFTLLQWMMAFNLALTVAVLWMLIRA